MDEVLHRSQVEDVLTVNIPYAILILYTVQLILPLLQEHVTQELFIQISELLRKIPFISIHTGSFSLKHVIELLLLQLQNRLGFSNHLSLFR